MTGRKKKSKGAAFKALGSMYGSGLKAVFRRKRRDAYTGDADERRQEMAKLAVRVASDVGGTRAKSLFVGRRKRAKMREEAVVRASRDVLQTMGEMKGLAMKVAQLGSFMMELPEEAETDLAKLQASAPPMDGELIIGVLEQEFGTDVMSRFSSFDKTPIASASIGQVHRATLKDGRDVVLKVQYPGIDKAVMADLEAFDEMTKVYALTGGDFDGMVESMEQTLRDELDYRREAENQTHFARLYAGHPFVKIPEVIEELSSQRVLTSEFVPGVRLYDVLDRPQEERDRLGEIIYRFAFGSICQGVFSGDPHPGNYLFMDDGRVCFIDFGFVERFEDPEADVAVVKAPLTAYFEGDKAGIAAGLRGLGLLPAKGRSNPDKLWEEVRPLLFGPIDQNAVTRLDTAAVSAAFRESMKMTSELNKMRKSTNLQPWISLLMRYAGGTLAVIGKLQADANWQGILRELTLDEEPTTVVGKQWAADGPPRRRSRSAQA